MHSQLLSYKGSLKKWLLTTTLFFSLFNFSGYVGPTLSVQAQAVQTELVFSYNHHVTRQSVSFYSVYTDSCFTAAQVFARYHYPVEALAAYNRLISVKLKNSLKIGHQHLAADCFLQHKTIPQSSNEDSPLPLLG
jgi:hypothetical protein